MDDGSSDIGVSEPGDVVINVPAMDDSIVNEQPNESQPQDPSDILADQLDEVELGIVETFHISFLLLKMTRL